MAEKQQTRDQTRHTALSRLRWRSATRDDQAVAQAIHAGEEIDALYNLDEAGVHDEFYHFLEQIGFVALIGGLHLPGARRVLVPVVQYQKIR